MFAIYLDLENQDYIVVEVPRMIDILIVTYWHFEDFI